MNRWMIPGVVFLAALFAGAGAARAGEDSPVAGGASAKWQTSLEAAQALARQSGKPILIYFSGSDWCIWCQKAESEILRTAQFGNWAEKNVVLVKIDFPLRTRQDPATRHANAALVDRYGVDGFPTFVFVTAEAVEFGRIGYVGGGARAWIPRAHRILVDNSNGVSAMLDGTIAPAKAAGRRA